MELNQPLTFEEIFDAPKPTTLEGLRALGIRGITIGSNPNAREEDVVAEIIKSLVSLANETDIEEMDYDADHLP